MGSIDANDCRSGTKLLVDGELYTVLERDHHKPGKGGAFVRFKLKGLISGKVVDHTVRAGTKMESADVSVQPMQYLYQEGDHYVFMDLETYEQIHVPGDLIGWAHHFLTENTAVNVTMYEDRAIGVELPQKMVFAVVDTMENATRGNTATSATKPAKLETGLEIQVPMFIRIGDRVRVATEDGSYVERVAS